jgi:hypothetical protein
MDGSNGLFREVSRISEKTGLDRELMEHKLGMECTPGHKGMVVMEASGHLKSKSA